MNSARIIEMGEVKKITTKYGEKEKCNILLAEASTGKEYECGYFIPKTGINFVAGETVLCEISEKDGFYNVKNIQKFETPNIEPKKEVVETVKEPVIDRKAEEREMWNGKERRDFKGRGLAYAINFVDMLLKHGFYTEQDKGDLSRDLMWTEVLKYANWSNDEIYEGNLELEKEDHLNPFKKEGTHVQ